MTITETAYVSGPMRGKPGSNFDGFDDCAGYLRALDFIVLSPAEHDRECGSDGHDLDWLDLHEMFRWDIDAILRSSIVVCLPGWEQSTGANLEVQIARAIGVPVWQYNPAGVNHAMRLVVIHAVGDGPEAELTSPLAEALEIVHGARQDAYGHPIEDFTRTGRIWGAILGVPDIDPALVGLCMAGVKISREVNKPKHDNRVDMAGYVETVHLIRERQSSS